MDKFIVLPNGRVIGTIERREYSDHQDERTGKGQMVTISFYDWQTKKDIDTQILRESDFSTRSQFIAIMVSWLYELKTWLKK